MISMAIFACPGRAGLGRFLDLTPRPYVEGAVAVKNYLLLGKSLFFLVSQNTFCIC